MLFRRFGDSSLDFELRAWVADMDTRLQVASDLHQDIDRRFRQAGIVFERYCRGGVQHEPIPVRRASPASRL